jgi:hypothetical protein
MADLVGMQGNDALTFMVSAGLVYEVVAAACSSPQTTEINAGARSKTLMKWVGLGLGQAAVFVGIAAFVLSTNPKPALLGGGLAGAMMLGSYLHANKAGLASNEPGTENYTNYKGQM